MRDLHHRNDLARSHVFEVKGHQALLVILLQPHEGTCHDPRPIVKSVLADAAGTDHCRHQQTGLPRFIVHKIQNAVEQLRRKNA